MSTLEAGGGGGGLAQRRPLNGPCSVGSTRSWFRPPLRSPARPKRDPSGAQLLRASTGPSGVGGPEAQLWANAHARERTVRTFRKWGRGGSAQLSLPWPAPSGVRVAFSPAPPSPFPVRFRPTVPPLSLSPLPSDAPPTPFSCDKEEWEFYPWLGFNLVKDVVFCLYISLPFYRKMFLVTDRVTY